MQTIVNLGTGGADLNGQNGSTTSADSNDALFLDWPGDNGGNYVYLPGVAGNYLSVPDEAALDITGDIDIRVRVALDDWTPGANMTLLSKYNAGGNQRSYNFQLNTSGTLSATWSEDGTSGTFRIATSSVSVSASDQTALWVRVTIDVDNGAGGKTISFSTSSDGATWATLGSDQVSAGTTSLYAGSAPVEVGTLAGGTQLPLAAKVYRAQVLNGISGTPVLDIDCSQIASGADTSFTAATGQTVTINRSTSGRKSVAVVSPVWLFGTDDQIRVANNPLWARINNGEAITVVVAIRQWATPPASSYWIGSRNGTNAEGYGLLSTSGNTTPSLFVDDGPTLYYRTGPSLTYGETTLLAGVLDLGATQEMYMYTNGSLGFVLSLSGVSVDTDGYLSIGSTGGFGYADCEVISVAVFRRALTAAEIAQLSTYYQSKVA